MKESGNFPPGAEFNVDAPYNEPRIPNKDFDLTVSQSLSKDITVCTDRYNLDDIKDTEWGGIYSEEHYTPLQLIQMYKNKLKEQLESWEGMEDLFAGKKQIRMIEHLIEECEGWTNDETVVCQS